jgi:hypothetical protein
MLHGAVFSKRAPLVAEGKIGFYSLPMNFAQRRRRCQAKICPTGSSSKLTGRSGKFSERLSY